MKWSRMNYPEPMRSLREDVRLRAIDIANKLVKKGVEENCAILAAMDRAAAWEHHPGKPARRAEERRNYRERHKKA